MADPIPRSLADLLDRDEIRDLVNRYFDCMWRTDIEGALDLFAPEGELVLVASPVDADGGLRSDTRGAPDTVVKGLAAIRALYERILVTTRPLPFGHNTIIMLESDSRASGRTYAELRQSDNFSWRGVFTLSDEYAKIHGVWKFARRTLAMRHVAPASN